MRLSHRVRFARRIGFTLIELLIVIAIIAILALIAIPNFIEAQTRAKVSRVAADLRTLATGVEAYFVDYNSYPFDQDNEPDKEYEQGLKMITTPIAYTTIHPRDPFQPIPVYDDGDLDNAPWYIFGSGSDNIGASYNDKFEPSSGLEKVRAAKTPTGFSGPLNSDPVPQSACFVLVSRGPDDHDTVMGSDYFPWMTWDTDGEMDAFVIQFYDPTNGTISKGDICRFGGSYQDGDWCIGWYDDLDEDVTEIDTSKVTVHTAWGGISQGYPNR